MPAISFSTLKDKILSGKKTQTIRPLKTDYWLQWERGDRLVGYWKQRTKDCEKLFESKFSEDPWRTDLYPENKPDRFHHYYAVLAQEDGFDTVKDMLEWFDNQYGQNFRGNNDFVVIRWKNPN